MKHIINVKELRNSLPEIIKKVRLGDKFTVLYRSRPAFRIIPVGPDEEVVVPLAKDPLYGAPAVGSTKDGLTSQDHDLTLYGKNAQ